MSSPPAAPPGTSTPSSSSETSSDNEFALALYSRVHQEYITNRTTPTNDMDRSPNTPTDSPTDSPTSTTPLLSSLSPLSVPDADQDSARLAEDNTTRTSFQNDCPRLPVSFVERVRIRLREGLGEGLREDPSAEPSTRNGVQSGVQDGAQDNAQDTPTPQSFLDRAEQHLQHHYDRLIQHDDPLQHTATPTALSFTADEATIQRLFRERYGVSLDQLSDQLERVVNGVIHDYDAYFAEESAIVAAAEHCDQMERWLKESRQLFAWDGVDSAEAAEAAETTEATNAAEATEAIKAGSVPTSPSESPLQTLLDTHLQRLPQWSDALSRARVRWQNLQMSRHALRRCEALFGGRQGCRICFNAQVGVVLIPCGHVLCAECAERVGQCPFCNTAFYSRQRMYLM